MANKLEYPQLHRNDDGAELVALNDVQSAAFENNGFKPVGKYSAKQGRQKTEE